MPDPDPVNPNPGKPDASSNSIDPGMAGSARQSPYPDADVYERPASTRASFGNLTLSIAVVAIVGILLILLFIWIWLRAGGNTAEGAAAIPAALFSPFSASLLPVRFR
jgi:hypothetical protein